jgi:FtsP/CotA-like multicopper oxidase with cupredoxin domain
MADMGMSHESMSHGGMSPGAMDSSKMDHAAMGHAMPAAVSIPTTNADGIDPNQLKGKPSVDNVAIAPKDRLGEAGTGLDGNGRRVLTYRDLRSIAPRPFQPPQRAIEFHITGNMERWVWGFNGKKFSESKAVRVKLGERVRFVMINHTMMEHPIHLHGFLFEVENGQGDRLPLKHTVNVKPGERMSFVFTADQPGHWAFHCHLLYHMEMGMFRTVLVS